MKKPNVIIHIGDGKCGTTSVQEGLSSCRDLLEREHNILYHPIGINHFEYIELLGRKTRSGLSGGRERAQKNISEIREKCTSSYYDYIIFSAECFFDNDPAEIMNLISQAVPSVRDVLVIAYIRDPVAYYLSVMQQKLKGSHLIIPPQKFRRNHACYLARWDSLPEVTRLVVRQFDRPLLKSGSVVSDFSALLSKLTCKAIDVPERSENQSLTAEQLITLQMFRRDFLINKNGEMSSQSNALISFYHEMNRVSEFSGSKLKLSASAAVKVAESNFSFVRILEEQYPEIKFTSRLSICPYDLNIGAQSFSDTDVRAILASYDNDIVSSLKSLNPMYGADSRKTSTENLNLLKLFSEGDRIVSVYENFCRKMSPDRNP